MLGEDVPEEEALLSWPGSVWKTSDFVVVFVKVTTNHSLPYSPGCHGPGVQVFWGAGVCVVADSAPQFKCSPSSFFSPIYILSMRS